MIKIKLTDEIVQAIDQAAGDDERAAYAVLAIVERDLVRVTYFDEDENRLVFDPDEVMMQDTIKVEGWS